MLMELADERLRSAKSGSTKACFTIAWQSSNLPSTAKTVTFSPRVVICFLCLPVTSSSGKRTTTLMLSRP